MSATTKDQAETPAVGPQANGAVIQDLPTVAPDLATFQQELDTLLQKYSLQLVPYIITFNNGTQIADAKFVPIQK